MSTRNRGRGLTVALVALLVAIVAVEVGWRLYMSQVASPHHRKKWSRSDDLEAEELRYLPHPYLIYALNPAYRDRDGWKPHNSLGFRGPEFPRAKPAGTYRIAFLGGSSTYDTGIRDNEETFCAQLQSVLREEYGHAAVHVVNAGVGGYTSWESSVNLQLRVLELEPDLVVVYHGTNDVHPRLVPPERYRRDNTGYRRSWTEDWHVWDHSLFLHYLGVQWGISQRNTIGAHTEIRYGEDEDREAHLDANAPRYFRENLVNIAVLARQRGAAVLLTSWAHSPEMDDYAATDVYQRGFAEINAVSADVARELGLAFYDFAALMPVGAELWDDGRHNNAAGARRKAELFAAFLDREVLGGA